MQTGRGLLHKAKDHVKDARALLANGSHGSALAFAEDALVNCADAVLAKDGWRVKGKTGAHQARFEYPGLPQVFASQAQLITMIRSLRNTEVYEPIHVVTPKQASDAITLAETAITEAAPLLP